MTTPPHDPQAYQFTNDWFGVARPIWARMLPQINPDRILEIGSFEGASACFLIDLLAARKPLEIHCVDPWGGRLEKHGVDMDSVQHRFTHNTRLAMSKAAHPVALHAHQGFSDRELPRMLAEGKQGYFDFVYVDGSHQAPDVLCDAVLGFKLLKVGGVMAFDDYLWAENPPQSLDPVRCPKPAVDAFVNLYCRKLRVMQAPLYQLYIQKLAD